MSSFLFLSGAGLAGYFSLGLTKGQRMIYFATWAWLLITICLLVGMVPNSRA